MQPITPDRENIESGSIQEGRYYDFKRELNLADERGKISFIDDVVAFLNKGAAHIIVGVDEAKGIFKAWKPLAGDPNKLAEQIQSVVQGNILPRPLYIDTHVIALPDHGDGFALDVRIPEHNMRPYQNKITGGFKIRTDKQNAIISRDDLPSMFQSDQALVSALRARMSEESKRVEESQSLADDGPIFEIAIIPRTAPSNPLNRRQGIATLYPHHGLHETKMFRPCQGGSEALDLRTDGRSNCRLYIGDDWFVLGTVVHPFSVERGHGHLTLDRMRIWLLEFLEGILGTLNEGNVTGPYALEMSFSQLQRGDMVGRYFPGQSGVVRCNFPSIVEEITPEKLVEAAYVSIQRASRYG
jgi:hypothetical protein